MKNQFKKLSVKLKAITKLDGKKRYIAAALIIMEIASLPAAAQIVNKVVFQVRPVVTAVEIPTQEAGLSRFLVVSNAPFTVHSANIVGQIDVSIHKSGDMNGQRFGDNAQIPGPKTSCASVTTPSETVIYQAERKTALSPGTALSQAVIIQVQYDASAQPDIKFVKDKASKTIISQPTSCAVNLS